MRFIGNKENLLERINTILSAREIEGESFFDFFSGTANVGKFFKKKGYRILSSDLLYFSYCLQQAYLVNNSEPKFDELRKHIPFESSSLFASPLEMVIEFLNSIPGIEGFIYKNYTPEGTKELGQPRMFFIGENGRKIDAIRFQIESWKNDNLITENEYFILLACLVESVPFYANISGVYAAFLKSWDPRAVKPLNLRSIEIVPSNRDNVAFNRDSVELLSAFHTDILYLDPPYNQRQYAPNYHLLETIARYDDPSITGVVGMREYSNLKSKFCNAQAGIEELDRIAGAGNFRYLILSYNSEGIMPPDKIISVLKKYGSVELVEFDYLRFKSNNNGDAKHKKHIKEQLYILTNSNSHVDS